MIRSLVAASAVLTGMTVAALLRGHDGFAVVLGALAAVTALVVLHRLALREDAR